MKNVIKYNKKIKGWRFLIMLFYLCETSRSKEIALLHPLYPSVYLWIRKKVWRSGRILECKPEDIGSRPGDVTFQTIHFCRRSSICVKFCWKSSIFMVKLSTGMRKLFPTPGWIGPASPDAGVELLRQLFFTVYRTHSRKVINNKNTFVKI